MRDLLDLPIDAAALLPGDDSSEGFDNIASVLSVSPALMQAYVSAAAKISRLAVGDPTTSPGITTYARPAGCRRPSTARAMPLGTRGGMRRAARVPARRRVRVPHRPHRRRLRPAGGWRRRGGRDHAGRRAAARARPRTCRASVRLKIPAGPQTSAWRSSARRTRAAWTTCSPSWRSSAGVTSVAINGPFNADRARRHAEPAADLRLPARPADRRDGGCRCARRILASLATRAFRRPVRRNGRGHRHAAGLLRVRAHAPRLRDRHPVRAGAHARRSAVHLPLRARAGGPAGGRRLSRWAISSWPRGSRSSSGAACRTRSC